MFRNLGPGFVAGGTIAPARIVKLSTTADRTVSAATASTDSGVIGVSQQGQKRAPGLPGSDAAIAAEVGDELDVYGIGDVALLTAGAAVARNDPIVATTGGKGIPATTGVSYIVGRALTVAAGDLSTFKVLINPQQITL